MTKLARRSAQPVVKIAVDNTLDPKALLKRLYDPALSEDDFAIVVNNALTGKDKSYQRAFNRAMAIMYFNGEDRAIPKPEAAPKVVSPKPDALERENARHAARLRRLQLSQDAEAVVEKRALVRLASECTFHDLWKLGVTLGKKGDKRRVSEHTTSAERKQAGVEIA